MSRVENKQRLVALVSGSASTAYEIYKATQDGRLPRTELVALILSNPNAGSYFFENSSNLPEVDYGIIDPTIFLTMEEYGETLIEALSDLAPDVIGQYGFTPKTPKSVLERFSNVDWINQHGAPIDPSEYDFGGVGMGCAQRFHAARLMFVRATGRNPWTDVTAQRVGIDFDAGKVLKRGRVPILKTDDVIALQKRAIQTEWQVQIDTLREGEKGKLNELPPYNNLVLPGERSTLILVKEIAKILFDSHGNRQESPCLDRIAVSGNKYMIKEINRLINFLNPQQ